MSEIKKLTRLGGDTRKLAALLQAKAPKGEMLAYISPQEAALLKSRGGSGKPHADTGIPSYQIEDYFSAEDMNFSPAPQVNVSSIGMDPAYMAEGLTYEGEPNAFQPPPTAPLPPFSNQQRDVIRSIGEDAAGGAFGRKIDYGYPGAGLGYALRQEPSQAFAAPSLGAPAVSGGGGAGPGISDQISNALGIKKSDLPLLGLAGVQTLLGGQQTRRAARQGQQAARRMESMAAPYRAQGAQLQAQAQRGELTPQAQQSLQAAQAQIAQGVQARGGVGAAQAAGQVEAIRQQLLQSQADYGLKLSGIGDQIAMGAIREGIQADQYVNQLTSSYMNNVMRMVGSAYGQQQPMIVLGGGGR
jgi:hypothetical protein